MEIWISNDQEKVALTEAHDALIRRVAEGAYRLAGPDQTIDVELSITLVDNDEIQVLNREHRGLDQPTDVLSFSQLEGEELAEVPDGPLMLGDLVISLERCAEQAKEYGHSFERELGFLVAHGMLHLLGMDHQTAEEEAAMMASTEEILGKLGLTR